MKKRQMKKNRKVFEPKKDNLAEVISFNFRTWMSLLIANIAFIFHRNTLAVFWFLIVIVFLIMEEFQEMENEED